MLQRHGARATVQAGVLCTLCLVAVVVSGSTTARAVAAPAQVPAVAAPVPGYSDGAIAFSSSVYNGTHGVDGCGHRTPGRDVPAVRPLAVGTVRGRCAVVAGRSEMVHVAAMSPTGVPTVAVSEDDGTYPWQAGSTRWRPAPRSPTGLHRGTARTSCSPGTSGWNDADPADRGRGLGPATDMAGLRRARRVRRSSHRTGTLAFVDVPVIRTEMPASPRSGSCRWDHDRRQLADGSRPVLRGGSFLAFVAPRPGPAHHKPEALAQTHHRAVVHPAHSTTSRSSNGPEHPQGRRELGRHRGQGVVRAGRDQHRTVGRRSTQCADGASDVAWQSCPCRKDRVDPRHGRDPRANRRCDLAAVVPTGGSGAGARSCWSTRSASPTRCRRTARRIPLRPAARAPRGARSRRCRRCSRRSIVSFRARARGHRRRNLPRSAADPARAGRRWVLRSRGSPARPGTPPRARWRSTWQRPTARHPAELFLADRHERPGTTVLPARRGVVPGGGAARRAALHSGKTVPADTGLRAG